MITADEIIATLSEGLALLDLEDRVIWCNPALVRMADPEIEAIDCKFYRLFGAPEIIERDDCPLEAARSTLRPQNCVLRVEANKYIGVTVTPSADQAEASGRLIVLVRDITREVQQEEKLKAIYQAGEKLSDLSAQDIKEMNPEERTDLLKYNIIRDLKELLGVQNVEIRLLDPASGQLLPLLSEGMTPTAENRELYAREAGQGVTGHVAATAKSYLCRDTRQDSLYLEGAAEALSSYTIPLIDQNQLLGTLNVEASTADAFSASDRQFLEIYAHNLAQALHTLDLLQAETSRAYHESVEKVWRSIALPVDEILNDAAFVMDRYVGHDDDIIRRLRHMIVRARDIRIKIREVEALAPPAARTPEARQAPPLAEQRVLFVDADESIRRAAHHLLGQWGATVETAKDAAEAIALARNEKYNLAICDIFLPDMNGYEIFVALRGIQKQLPIILMTGFAYDQKHSIVKARGDGMTTVLYKPFRADRILEAAQKGLGRIPVEQKAQEKPASDLNSN
jgi:CheY-like chemotaxis protein